MAVALKHNEDISQNDKTDAIRKQTNCNYIACPMVWWYGIKENQEIIYRNNTRLVTVDKYDA